jgi:hypothetical protein
MHHQIHCNSGQHRMHMPYSGLIESQLHKLSAIFVYKTQPLSQLVKIQIPD